MNDRRASRSRLVRRRNILVVGESCKDVFVYCVAERLAPDVPVPVLSVVGRTENPGMAKNVERNIKALAADCAIYTNRNWDQITKTRYVHHASNHAFVRVDTVHRIRRAAVREIPISRYDSIAISDYDKGFLTEADIAYICGRHPNVFLDTKKVLGDWAAGARYIKINNFEYERSRGTISRTLASKIVRTKGGAGCVFRGKTYPVKRVEVKDTSGAGDSFFAALVVRYLDTGDIEKAIQFANKCASEVVQRRGVTVIQKRVGGRPGIFSSAA